MTRSCARCCAFCTSARAIPAKDPLPHELPMLVGCVMKGHKVPPASSCPWHSVGPLIHPCFTEVLG